MGLGAVFLWFLFLERAILTPFILAAIFAYVFNPLIDFLSRSIRLPRSLSIIIIYTIIVAVIVAAGILLTRRIINESFEFTINISYLAHTARMQAESLPSWLSPIVDEGLRSLEKSKIFAPDLAFSFFPKAISRMVSFIIFVFAAFYFLREGRSMIDKFLHFIPQEHRLDIEVMLRKMNNVFSGYLRGQLFMVAFVSSILFIALSIIGVRYALILAVFSGFAEIVPIIGPITATVVAVGVVLTDSSFNFDLSQIQVALLVAVIYFLLRQIQDYFITPAIMGRITNLHPLVILFSVLAGGHLFGIIGFILGVPVAASIRLLLEFALDKLA